MIPPLRLADLRDLTDVELRRHVFVRYMRPSEDVVQYVDEDDAEIDRADAFPNDDELAQRIGTVLVAYESVGDWGCDSSAYFLLERDGELYEVHGSHDSTCGFEGQWEPTLVTPSYLVSEHWRMSVGGYDEHRESGRACEPCDGCGYRYDQSVCRSCEGSGRVHDLATDSDLSTREVVTLWLHHRFGGELAEQSFALPEWAIPTWALHVDKDGNAVDLRAVDDRYLLNVVRWACREVRERRHADVVYRVAREGVWQEVRLPCAHTPDDVARAIEANCVGVSAVVEGPNVWVIDDATGELVTLSVQSDVEFTFRGRPPTARGSFVNAMREVEARGLLPTWDELRIAADVAALRGAMVHHPIAADEVACVPIDGGPWDLVDLWVGYKPLAYSGGRC